MQGMIIGVDLDDVTVDFTPAALTWHDRLFGTCSDRSAMTSYARLAELWRCTIEEQRRRTLEFCFTEEHKEIPLVAGAFESLKALSKKHTLVAVTSRPGMVEEQTLDLLERRRVRRFFSGFQFLGHYQGPPPEPLLTKAQACREAGAVYLIDDSLDHIEQADQEGLESALFDAPWNQGKVPARSRRVKTWKEICIILA